MKYVVAFVILVVAGILFWKVVWNPPIGGLTIKDCTFEDDIETNGETLNFTCQCGTNITYCTVEGEKLPEEFDVTCLSCGKVHHFDSRKEAIPEPNFLSEWRKWYAELQSDTTALVLNATDSSTIGITEDTTDDFIIFNEIEIELLPREEEYVYDPNRHEVATDLSCNDIELNMRPDGNIYLSGGTLKDFVICIYEGFCLDGKIFTGEIIVEDQNE